MKTNKKDFSPHAGVDRPIKEEPSRKNWQWCVELIKKAKHIAWEWCFEMMGGGRRRRRSERKRKR